MIDETRQVEVLFPTIDEEGKRESVVYTAVVSLDDSDGYLVLEWHWFDVMTRMPSKVVSINPVLLQEAPQGMLGVEYYHIGWVDLSNAEKIAVPADCGLKLFNGEGGLNLGSKTLVDSATGQDSRIDAGELIADSEIRAKLKEVKGNHDTKSKPSE